MKSDVTVGQAFQALADALTLLIYTDSNTFGSTAEEADKRAEALDKLQIIRGMDSASSDSTTEETELMDLSPRAIEKGQEISAVTFFNGVTEDTIIKISGVLSLVASNLSQDTYKKAEVQELLGNLISAFCNRDVKKAYAKYVATHPDTSLMLKNIAKWYSFD